MRPRIRVQGECGRHQGTYEIQQGHRHHGKKSGRSRISLNHGRLSVTFCGCVLHMFNAFVFITCLVIVHLLSTNTIPTHKKYYFNILVYFQYTAGPILIFAKHLYVSATNICVCNKLSPVGNDMSKVVRVIFTSPLTVNCMISPKRH